MRVQAICLMLLFSHCSKKASTSAINTSDNSSSLNKNIETEVGLGVEKVFNPSKSHLLVYRIKELTDNYSTYGIFEVSSGKLIKKGNYVPGHIMWIDDFSLELLSVPGTLPQGKSLKDYTTIILLKKEI